MTELAAHHQQAVDRALTHFSAKLGVLAVILAGSLARGTQTETSDLDLIIILDDDAYTRGEDGKVWEGAEHICDYPGGYVDLKCHPRQFLAAAAAQGSEPTRNAFLGTRCLVNSDPEIPRMLERIPVYPVELKQEKILSFYGALQLSRGFFWGEAQKRNDPYLSMRTMTDVVLFGCRLILAHNEMLFPSHKRMLEAVDACAETPKDFRALIDALLATPNNETIHACSEAVLNFRDWGTGDWYMRYIDDFELWWWKQRPYIAEW